MENYTVISEDAQWTVWPEASGPQFIALPRKLWGSSEGLECDESDYKMWVGNVEIYDDPEHGRRAAVWEGPGTYDIWENQANRWNFRFQKIVWPQSPPGLEALGG